MNANDYENFKKVLEFFVVYLNFANKAFDEKESINIKGFDEYIPAPTIFLVELKAKVPTGLEAGITEVMFGVEGSDKNEKAKTLYDCWTHSGAFSYVSK